VALVAFAGGLLAPTTATATPKLTDKEVNEICKKVVFSDTTNPQLGCVFAAAIGLEMPGTVIGVASKLDDWSDKRIERYNEKLEKLVRLYTWEVYDYLVGTQFGPKEVFMDTKTVSSDKVAEFLLGEATRLDIVAVGRFDVPHKKSHLKDQNLLLALEKKAKKKKKVAKKKAKKKTAKKKGKKGSKKAAKKGCKRGTCPVPPPKTGDAKPIKPKPKEDPDLIPIRPAKKT